MKLVHSIPAPDALAAFKSAVDSLRESGDDPGLRAVTDLGEKLGVLKVKEVDEACVPTVIDYTDPYYEN